jgi:hypothetical protein
MAIKIATLLILFIILVFMDKSITAWNLLVLKEQGTPNYLTAEKNIAARWFFEKAGLLWGSVLFGIVTIGTLSLCFWALRALMNEYQALWVIFLIYGAVISGNTFQLIKNYHLI